MLAETDAVESCGGIVAMTLSGKQTYTMHALLFYLPSVLINDVVSLTAATVVAAPTLKLCEA